MKKVTRFLNLLAVLIGLSAGVHPANAALRTVGPVSAVHGLPLWYQDVTGLSLQPCLDQTTLSTAGGLLCILPGPPDVIPGFDPTLDPAANTITTTGPINATNFPGEVFYWIADASADPIVTGGIGGPARFRLRMALEGNAFAPALTFMRINLQQMDGLVSNGAYSVSTPYGDFSFTADVDGVVKDAQFNGQTFRNQIDALPPLFDAILPGIFPAIPPQQALPITMDNFLVWNPAVLPAAPSGFIGDPNIPHSVVKAGDTAPAVVTFSGAGLAAPVTITQFALAGKIIGLVITPPANGTDFGLLKVNAPVAPTKTVTVSNLSPAIVNVVVASSNVTDFAIVNNTCGQLLPGTPPATCTFDVAFTPAADGLKTTTITVSDQAAAVPATTVNLSGTGDGTLPVVAITAPADASFTSDNTPLLTFSVTETNPGVDVVRVDGVVVTKVSGDSLELLADGSHTVIVDSTDAAGNLGSATATFTVDTIVPVVAITAPAAGLTQDNTPLLTFNVTDASPVTNVVKVDGVAVATVSGESLAQLADGPHTVRVESTDAAGNLGFAEVIITVDATAPVVTLTNPATGGFTNDNTPLLSFGVTDATAVTNVVRVDGVVVAMVSGDSLALLADGQHTVIVESTDAVGNLGSATSTFTVDTVLPVVSITAPAAGLTKINTPLLTFSATDTNAVTNVVRVDGVVVAKVSGDSLALLADGQHTVIVDSTDAAGNLRSATATFTVDTVVSPFTLNAVTTPTRVTSQTISGTVEAGTTVTVNGQPATVTGSTWSINVAGLVEGANSINLTATDPAGNTASQQSSIKIVLQDGKIAGTPTVTITDALMALRFAAGLAQPTTEELLHGDVAPLINGKPSPSPNGKVDIGDVVLVLRKVVNPTSW